MSSGVRSVLVPARVDLRRKGQLCDVEGLARLRMLSRVLRVQEQLLTAIFFAGSIGAMPAASETTTTTATTTHITTTTTTAMTMTTAMTTATPHDHRESDQDKDGDRNSDDDDVDGEDDADDIVVNSPKR